MFFIAMYTDTIPFFELVWFIEVELSVSTSQEMLNVHVTKVVRRMKCGRLNNSKTPPIQIVVFNNVINGGVLRNMQCSICLMDIVMHVEQVQFHK